MIVAFSKAKEKNIRILIQSIFFVFQAGVFQVLAVGLFTLLSQSGSLPLSLP